jgi:SAM-dependent methyltransferase
MQIYPVPARSQNLYETLSVKLGLSAGYCSVCGSHTLFRKWKEKQGLRESGACLRCGARNRQRQIALLADQIFSGHPRYRGLRDTDLAIFNLESNGSLHRTLSHNPNYVASEYLGPSRKPGELVDGVRHEDAQSLSFPDGTFDLVISSDVWEHIPRPYSAHSEVLRVLKPGGRHLFTVPFYQAHFLDEKRASLDADGHVTHHLEPIYHLDPLNPKGVLVYRIFSLEMLCRLARMGFNTRFHKLYSPYHGILGNNGIVFDAQKPR